MNRIIKICKLRLSFNSKSYMAVLRSITDECKSIKEISLVVGLEEAKVQSLLRRLEKMKLVKGKVTTIKNPNKHTRTIKVWYI